jgi:hypothetical protein
MPKRKQRQEVPSSDSEEEEQQQEPGDSSSSSDDEGDDSFPSGEEDSSEESSDDEAGEAFEQVDVDFGFYCPQEKDFQGLRTLLQNFLDGEQWASSGFADAIIQQVGCALLYAVRKAVVSAVSPRRDRRFPLRGQFPCTSAAATAQVVPCLPTAVRLLFSPPSRAQSRR